MNRMAWLLIVIILLSLATSVFASKKPAAGWPKKLAFIKVGMERTEFEERLGKILHKDLGYNIYVHAVQTEKNYSLDNKYELLVNFAGGTYAPYVQNPNGSLTHLEPADSKVTSFKIKKK